MTTKARCEKEQCSIDGCENRFSSLTGVCPIHRPVCLKETCNRFIKTTNNYGYCWQHWHIAEESKELNRSLKRKRQHASNKLFKAFGITLEDKEFMLLSQGNACAICKSLNPKNAHGWQTDHNHVTNKLRGILCFPCNTVVGYVEKGWPLIIPEIEKYLTFYS